MNNDTFKKQLDMREKIWAGIAVLLILGTFVGAAYYFGYIAQQNHESSPNGLSFIGDIFSIVKIAIIATVITGAVTALILKPVDFWLRRRFLKEYYLEDCGDVVKLHGSMRLDGSALARKELLSSRPGYNIVDDAYEKYGCTMAAIRVDEPVDTKE